MLTLEDFKRVLSPLDICIQEKLRMLGLPCNNRGLLFEVTVIAQSQNPNEAENLRVVSYPIFCLTYERKSDGHSGKHVAMAEVLKNQREYPLKAVLPSFFKRTEHAIFELNIRILETYTAVSASQGDQVCSLDNLVHQEKSTLILEDTFSIISGERKSLKKLTLRQATHGQLGGDVTGHAEQTMYERDADFNKQTDAFYNEILCAISGCISVIGKMPSAESLSILATEPLAAQANKQEDYQDDDGEDELSDAPPSALSLLFSENPRPHSFLNLRDLLSQGISANPTNPVVTSLTTLHPAQHVQQSFNPTYEYYPEDMDNILDREIERRSTGQQGRIVGSLLSVNFPDLERLKENIIIGLRTIESRAGSTTAYTAILPIHINTNHWVGCIIDINKEKKQASFHYIDTKLNHATWSPIDSLKNYLSTVLGEDYTVENVHTTTLFLQPDSVSCGPYFIAHAMHYAYGEPLSAASLEMIRGHHAALMGAEFSRKQFQRHDSAPNFQAMAAKASTDEQEQWIKSRRLHMTVKTLYPGTQDNFQRICHQLAGRLDSKESYAKFRTLIQGLYDIEFASNLESDLPLSDANLNEKFFKFLHELFNCAGSKQTPESIVEIIQHGDFNEDLPNILAKFLLGESAQSAVEKALGNAKIPSILPANQKVAATTLQQKPLFKMYSTKVSADGGDCLATMSIQHGIAIWQDMTKTAQDIDAAEKLGLAFSEAQLNRLFSLGDQFNAISSAFYPAIFSHGSVQQTLRGNTRYSSVRALSLLTLQPDDEAKRCIAGILATLSTCPDVVQDYWLCSKSDARDAFSKFPISLTKDPRVLQEIFLNGLAQRSHQENLRLTIRLCNLLSLHYSFEGVQSLFSDSRFNWSYVITCDATLQFILAAMFFREDNELDVLSVAPDVTRGLWDSYLHFKYNKELALALSSSLFTKASSLTTIEIELQRAAETLMTSIDKLHPNSAIGFYQFCQQCSATSGFEAASFNEAMINLIVSELENNEDNSETRESIRLKLLDVFRSLYQDVSSSASIEDMMDFMSNGKKFAHSLLEKLVQVSTLKNPTAAQHKYKPGAM
jgi:hypothetical protein